MSQVEAGQEQLIALPNFRDVEHVMPQGDLPYVLAEIALHEVICLRATNEILNKIEYAKRLRNAVDAAANSVIEKEFTPPLPESIAEKALEFSASLKHNDEV